MKLNAIAERLGFSNERETYVLTKNGYRLFLVNFKVPGALVSMPMIQFVFAESVDKDHQKALRKVIGVRGFHKDSVFIRDNAIVFVVPLKKKEKFDAIIDRLTKKFEALKLTDLTYCPYCKTDEDTTLRNFKGTFVPVHETCIKSYVEKTTHQLNTNASSKDQVLKSILLAFLGGFVGLIPSIVVLLTVGFYSAWLFILIPLAAFHGFKKGGAQRGGYVLPLISIISLILAPGFMLFVYYDLSVYFEITFAEMLTDTEIMSSFVIDMLLSIVFTLIAIGVSYRFLHNQTDGKLKKDLKGLNDHLK